MKENLNTFCIDYSKLYNSLDLKHDRDLKLLDEIKARVKEIEKSLWKSK